MLLTTKVLHRDLKAANVFLTSRDSLTTGGLPSLKLGDFGISRAMSTNTALAETVM